MRNVLKYIVVPLLPMLLLSSALHAQDTRKQERRKVQLEKEIAILDKQIAELSSQSSMMVSQLELTRQNIENRKALIEESNRIIGIYADSISAKNAHIGRLQSRVDTLTVHYERLVRSAYKNRDTKVWYMYIMASDNLGQAYRRYGYFKNLSSRMKTEAQTIRGLQAELEEAKGKLEVLKKDAEAVKADRKRELTKLQEDEKNAEIMVQQLQQDRQKCESQVAAKRREVEALNREIQRIIEEAMKEREKIDASRTDAAAVALSDQFASNKSKLPWPVAGTVVARFGKQNHPVFKNLELPPNNGIDIAVDKGTEAKSVFEGVVSHVFVMPGYNQCVLVQHGNSYFTFYCKLGTVYVKKGDKVVTGQSLGVVETSLGQTQLHFELWLNKTPQNPTSWLR